MTVKKYEIANEFNILLNTLSSIMIQKDKFLIFNYGSMEKIKMAPYLDIDKKFKWFKINLMIIKMVYSALR